MPAPLGPCAAPPGPRGKKASVRPAKANAAGGGVAQTNSHLILQGVHIIIIPLHTPLWRNWQTQQTQNLPVATSCRFDPGQRHQPEWTSLHTKKPSQMAGLFLYRRVILPSSPQTLALRAFAGPRPVCHSGPRRLILSGKPKRSAPRPFPIGNGRGALFLGSRSRQIGPFLRWPVPFQQWSLSTNFA